uniref:SSD domain-containing protein n=1 Tax=Parascaris univalens TaxID=6257 RepID=A0A915AUF4_PARUN
SGTDVVRIFDYQAQRPLCCRFFYLRFQVTTIFTLICSIKIPFTQIQDDFKLGYTPADARSLVEMKIYNDFARGGPLTLFLFLMAADGGSMIRMKQLNETVKIIEEIGTQLKMRNQSFYDICTSFCDVNEPVVQFRNGMMLKSVSSGDASGALFDNLSLRYPIMTSLGYEFDLSPNFHGVETYEEGEEPKQAFTNIKYVKVIMLIVRVDKPDSWTDEDANRWDAAIRKRFNEDYNTSVLVPRAFSFPFFEEEVTRASLTAFPYVFVGLIIMVVFSVVTVTISAWYLHHWTLYKMVLATMACITPIMATASCLGLLFWCGLRFASVLLITPFLLLAIGVDDAYIIINAWGMICVERTRHPVPGDTLHSRITKVLHDAGPSITLTSLTNMLAFAVGAYSATPEIQLFCIANAVAMFFDLVYTVILYMPVLVICARCEKKPEGPDTRHSFSEMSHFCSSYCKWLSSGYTSICMLLIMCAYWSISIYGIKHITPNIQPSKLVIIGSPMEQLLHMRDKYVQSEYLFVTVIVGNAGNLTDPRRRQRIHSMVEQFESMPECNGQRFTYFWMRDYDRFMSTSGADIQMDEDSRAESSPYSSQSIQEFLQWSENKIWGSFIVFDNNTKSIPKFSLVVRYHGPHIVQFTEKLRMLKEWRAIAENYTDLSATIYNDDAVFTDQIESLIPRTSQSTLYCFACMLLLCSVFMPNLIAVFAASVPIVSIFIGVAGFMTLWHVDLDPISMMALILSIGMSVDYLAHITYHYYNISMFHPSMSSVEVMQHALSNIAYPLLQCCLSNVFFVLCLLFVNTYITRVIVKTVLLVVFFGSMHALVIIPAFLCAFSKWRFKTVVQPVIPTKENR